MQEYEFKLIHPIRTKIKYRIFRIKIFLLKPFPKLRNAIIEKRSRKLAQLIGEEWE